jgi:hypothetical protein
MLQKIFYSAIAVFSSSFAFAQNPNSSSSSEEITSTTKPFLTVSGSADAYFKYDVNKQSANNKTSFTNTQNAFSLGMASVKFEHSSSKVAMVADLGFGTRATEFAYNDAGILAAVKQLYVSYTPLKTLKFTAGSWATHVGYELVDPQLNRNYSMGYMFTNGPFTHSGLKAEYTKGKHGFMLGISNPTDFRTILPGKINKKFAIAQYSVSVSDAAKVYLNYVGGKNQDTSLVNQFDIVATITLNKKFNVGFNGTINNSKKWDGTKSAYLENKSWWGAAGYFNYDPNSWLGLTLRSELFNDNKSVKGFGTSIFANTLSANFKADGFTIIPEIRYESAGQTIYSDKTGSIGKKQTLSFLVAAIYKF